MTFLKLFRQPSAFLPVLVSIAALGGVLAYVAVVGVVQQPDERAPARIFQLMMIAQLPVIIYFGSKWIPLAPKTALQILALQIAAWMSPVVLLLFLEG